MTGPETIAIYYRKPSDNRFSNYSPKQLTPTLYERQKWICIKKK